MERFRFMQKLQVIAVFAATAAALATSGCSDPRGDSLMGQWSGTVGSLSLNLDVNTGYESAGSYFSGTLRTSDGSCFKSGMLVARVSDNTVEIMASGSGSKSQNSIIRITGEQTTNTIAALFSMSGELGATCDLATTEFTLRRK
jgi:hypothetical protein